MSSPRDDFDSMDCEKSTPCVSQYLDNCPQDIECQTIIKALVERCSTCSETHRFEMHVRTVVSKRCSDEVPQALKAKIFQALQQVRDDC